MKQMRGVKKGYQYRYIIAVMVFSASLITTMLRVHISISALGLLDHFENTPRSFYCKTNNTMFMSKEYNDMPKLIISKNMFAWFLASYYTGYVLTTFSGNTISVAIGPLWTVGALTIFASLMTGIIPYMVHLNFYTGIVNMFFVGLCGGPMIPAFDLIIYNWAPPQEKRYFKLLSSLGYMSGFLIWPLIGFLVAEMGWQWGFFTPCLIGLIWCFLWLILVSNDPETSRFTSEKEKKYIQAKQHRTVRKIKRLPYGDILKSKPVWAFLMARLGISWIMTDYISMPIFIKLYSGYSIKEIGLFCALPIIVKSIIAFTGFKVYNILIDSKRASPIGVQKIFIFFSHFGTLLVLPGLYIIKCEPIWIIVFLTAYIAIGGIEIPIALNYPQQISSNFSSFIFNVCVIFPIIWMSIIKPALLIGEITGFNFIMRCNVITAIGILLNIVGGLTFLTCGSDTIQPWDD